MFQDARLILSKIRPQYRAYISTERECLLWSYIVAIDAWKIGSGSDLLVKGAVLCEEMRPLFPDFREGTLLDGIFGKLLLEWCDGEQKCSV